MAAIKCVNCGHRTLLPTAATQCPNCGESFPSPSGLPAPSSPVSALGSPFPPSQAQILLPPSGSVQQGQLSPSPAALAPNPYMSGMPAAQSSVPYPLLAPSHHVSLLPGMPKTQPDAEGLVVSQHTQQETIVESDIVLVIWKAIWDILWPVRDAHMNDRAREQKLPVTTVRIYDATGEQRDVRVEGEFMGGSIALGDKLSLWGHNRKGTLVVRRAYNHTSHAEVRLRSKREPAMQSLIILVSILLVFIALLVWYHILVLWPSPHFDLHLAPLLPTHRH